MAIMYNRPMTKEEEERIMMAQSLKNNNMMTADANMIGPEVMTDADAAMLNERSRGAELIPPGADMSQFNDVTGAMGTSMTPEQIDEEIRRLQILKNNMLLDQLKDMGYGRN